MDISLSPTFKSRWPCANFKLLIHRFSINTRKRKDIDKNYICIKLYNYNYKAVLLSGLNISSWMLNFVIKIFTELSTDVPTAVTKENRQTVTKVHTAAARNKQAVTHGRYAYLNVGNVKNVSKNVTHGGGGSASERELVKNERRTVAWHTTKAVKYILKSRTGHILRPSVP